MQLRCTYCQTMFALSHDEMLAALQHMEQHGQKYYDAHCPKCRRANRVEGKRIELFFPDWKKTIKSMERDAAREMKAEEKPVEIKAEIGTKKSANRHGGKLSAGKKMTGIAKKRSTRKSADAVKSAAVRKSGSKASGAVRKK